MKDCVVIGAGPAGLAASVALTARGVDHVVLERSRAGHTWRTQRWDGLRLNNPGWMNPMLGEQPAHTYLTAAEVVERLEKLAACAPLREHTAVTALSRRSTSWVLHTTDGPLPGRTVVVATGGENVPRTPALARRLPARITQLHSAHYRRPDELPPGPVLVVGSAQSGYQIAEELLDAGRPVVLATGRVGRARARHRGRDTLELLAEAGFFDQTPDDLPDPSVMHAPQPLLAPGGRSASLQALARAGAILVGHLVAVDGRELRFDGSVAANIAAADAFAARIRVLLDEAAPLGHPVPAAEPDPADLPVTVNPPAALDVGDIDSVIWCTGYTGDFSWLDASLRDDEGRPRRHGAAAPLPGLWYVGLRWLTRRRSGNFFGFPVDAGTVADGVVAALYGGRNGRLERC